MAKVYIVNEVDWIYNDEAYYTDSDSGDPLEAYHSREKAEEVCDRMNLERVIQEFKEGCFNYSLVTTRGIKTWCEEVGIDPEEMEEEWGYTGDAPVTLTEDQAKKLLKISKIKFYTVSEISFKD